MSEKVFNHDEIRLLILGRLYEKYYHGGTYTFQQCEDLFSDLLEKDADGLAGDLVYVAKKKWVEPLQPINSHMPSAMFINERGIDQYENAMRVASDRLLQSGNVPQNMKQDIESGTWDKIDEWMDDHPSVIRVFSKLFVSALQGNVGVDN